MAQLALDNVSKTFLGRKSEKVHAIRSASFTVEDKELVVLVGPSGCGKTTILRLIAGLDRVTSGTIRIGDKVVNDVAPKDRDIAMVFQSCALYPHMTARENMAFGLKLRQYPQSEVDRRIDDAAAMLELGSCINRKPKALSGGQRQRVALGRAIVREPAVFLFDEPLSNLDAQIRSQIRAEISALHARIGATMLYVTHDQTEAMTLGNRIIVMKEGVIQQIGAPMEVYRRPSNMFIARFIGSPPMNFLLGKLAREGQGLILELNGCEEMTKGNCPRLHVNGKIAARLDGYSGRNVIVGLRPEDISEMFASSVRSMNNTIEAIVEKVEPIGHEAHVRLKAGATSFLARSREFACLRPNQRVSFALNMNNARFFDPATETAIF